jgi:hypothetical protein
MVYAMDTLGYAKRLRDAGVPPQQAEAHAEAARDFVMGELVTKTDLQNALQLTRTDLQNALQLTRTELQNALQLTRTELQNAIQLTKTDLQNAIQLTKTDLQNAMQVLERKTEALDSKIDTQTLRLTVRLGGLLAAAIAILAAVVKLG